MKFMKIMKTTFFIMAIIITATVTLMALYFNLGKLKGVDVSKYTQLRVDTPSRVEEIAAVYTDPVIKEKFIAETKRLNSINSSGYISNQTIIVPVFE